MDDELLTMAGVKREPLVGMAYRMLGSIPDAEDAVQEAFVRWYRLTDSERARVHNPIGWFAKTTSRICLDVLKSASRRHDLYVGPWLPEPVSPDRFLQPRSEDQDPASRVAETESLSMALLTVMEQMTPAERVAFVMRDVFEYPIADIAEVLDRSPGAVRQLASSARARINREPQASRRASSELVSAFQRAASHGDVAGLLKLLHPDVVLRSDGGGVVRAALNPLHGSDNTARFIIGVLAKQSTTSLTLVPGPAGSLIAFEKSGATHGILQVVPDPTGTTVAEVLIQWNPEKLRTWQAT